MVLKKGDFSQVLKLLSDAFEDIEPEDVEEIHLYDPAAYINRTQQAPSFFVLKRADDGDYPIAKGPTVGPMFRPQFLQIELKDKNGSIIFSNAEDD